MHALGIDVGSTNVKVVLVDEDHEVLAEASRPLATTRDGEAVGQDAEHVWAAVCEATREVTSAAPDAAAQLASVGVCSQYSSLVPVDEHGAALAPIKLYLDTRGSDRCWAIIERHPEAFEIWVDRHGIPPIGGGLTLGHLLHFTHDEPETHAATATYLEVMDLVNLRLTGRIAATTCTMFASQLCAHRTDPDGGYDPTLLELAGIDPGVLPELGPVDGVHGTLLDEVADALGLPAGIPVQAGMNDTQAGAFATGALAERDRCGLVVGTTAVLIQSLAVPGVDLEREVLAMPVPVPGRYVVMAENGIAGRAVERALELLSPEPADPDRQFAELEAALTASPPGARGLLFLPWLAGSMSPSSSSDMRGGFIGMSLDTERSDVLRSTVEGVARNLRWLLPAVEDLSGTRAARLVFAGGAARSRGVAQVVADVTGREVAVVDQPHLAAARAVAAVALARVGGRDPAGVNLPVATTIEPDGTSGAVHDRLQPIFEDAFTRVRPVCEALRS